MGYPCSICSKHVRLNAIYCNCCKQWTHRRCSDLNIAELEYYSHVDDDWFCRNCMSIMFPFTQISDDELHYLSVGIDDNIIDVYDNCSGLNYEPFKCSETKEYFTTDKIDPDNNVHNKLDVCSLYYTEEQFKYKFRSPKGKGFSIIHFNCRSISSNFSKLKDSVFGLELEFDVIDY